MTDTSFTFKPFQGLTVTVTRNDWQYLCDHRWFTNTPTADDIQTEFITGTGITPNQPELFSSATEEFHQYVDELRMISKLDINKMAHEIISKDELISEDI